MESAPTITANEKQKRGDKMAYDGSLVFDTTLNTEGFNASLAQLSTITSSFGGLDVFCSKLLSVSTASIRASGDLTALYNQSFLAGAAFNNAFNADILLNTVQNCITKIINLLLVGTKSQQIFTAGLNIVNTVANGVNSNFSLLTAVQNSISSAKNTANSSVSSAGFSSVGSQMVSGIAAGVSSGASAVVSAMVSAVNSAISAAKSAAQIRSPSRIFDLQVGQMMMKGLENGINAGAVGVSDAVKKSMQKINNTALSFVPKSTDYNSGFLFGNTAYSTQSALKASAFGGINTLALQKQAESILALMKHSVDSSAINFMKNSHAFAYGLPVSGAGNNSNTTNLYMTVNTHDSLNESELTRQAQDFLTRARRKLP